MGRPPNPMKLLLFTLITVLGLTGCMKTPVTVVTPQGKTAYSATQILQRVGELQSTAIQAESSKAIPTPVARIIIQYCVNAENVLKATPAGWQATVTAAWQQAKGQLPPGMTGNPAWSAAIAAVDLVLAATGGTSINLPPPIHTYAMLGNAGAIL